MIELPWGSIQAAKIVELDKIEIRKGYTMSCALNLYQGVRGNGFVFRTRFSDTPKYVNIIALWTIMDLLQVSFRALIDEYCLPVSASKSAPNCRQHVSHHQHQ